MTAAPTPIARASQLSLFEKFDADFPESDEIAINISAKKGILYGLNVESVARWARGLRAGREFQASVTLSVARVSMEYHDAKKDSEESGVVPTVYLRIEDLELPE